MSSPPVRAKRPSAHPLLRLFGKLYLGLTGWQVLPGDVHKYDKFVAIGAYHTSNWDAPLALATFGRLNIRANFMIKAEYKRSVLWPIFSTFGGVPVDRSKANQVVSEMVREFSEREHMILVIAPEGTRKKVDHWRMGFYHIAVAANVPILLGYADYEKKVVGFDRTVFPTGDLEADMPIFQEFYADVHPKYPEKAGTVILRSREESG